MTELAVGRILKSHGLTGELVVEIRTDDIELRFARGSTLCVRQSKNQQELATVHVGSVRYHNHRLLVTFEEIADRSAADQLRGAYLVINSEDLGVQDDPDEFYDHELIGMAVHDRTSETHLGEIVDVLHTDGNEWIVMKLPTGREVLIPFVAAIVVEVSREKHISWVMLPEGLLDL